MNPLTALAMKLDVSPAAAAAARETLLLGLPSVDSLTGGFPRGAISEVIGAESSGRPRRRAVPRHRHRCGPSQAGRAKTGGAFGLCGVLRECCDVLLYSLPRRRTHCRELLASI